MAKSRMFRTARILILIFESKLPMSIIQKLTRQNLILLFAFASVVSWGSEIVSAQSGTRVIPRRTGPSGSSGRTVINQGSGSNQSGSTTRNVRSSATVGLSGYCPVCIVDMKKWVKGNSKFASQFDGMTYLFPNAEIKKKFDSNPSIYVPAMGGYDVVAKKNNNQTVMGSVFQGAALHEGRVYLFSTVGNKSMFLNTAKDFEKIDLALGGMCAVCKASGMEHAGKSEFRYVYQKMTYLFPTAKELAEFKSNPAKYAQK